YGTPTAVLIVSERPGDSNQLPVRKPPSDSSLSAGEPRYSEKELGMIFKRAAELQEEGETSSGARFTLAEIQQIGAEVGIAPRNIAAAAAGMASDGGAGKKHRFFGAPTRFR